MRGLWTGGWFICWMAYAGSVASQSLPVQSVTAWNELIMTLAVDEDALLTLRGVRTLAMAHLAAAQAMDDVVKSQQDKNNGADINQKLLVAFNQAMFTVGRSQYPGSESRLLEERQRWLEGLDVKRGERAGHRLGESVANHVLAERSSDGWDSAPAYQWHPMAPGVYAEFSDHSGTPEGFIFGAGWAQVKPFVLPSAQHFRVKPPPDIASDEYTRAFNEVKVLGATNSLQRSADQTHLALWWKDFVENSHNRLLRQLVVSRGLDGIEANKIMARLNVAIIDGYISAFDSKFHYNHWRPFTAIRWAGNDQNPATDEDSDWNNTHNHTYAFPSYPSAHGTACAAAMTILADAFGDETAFTMTTETVDIAGPMSGPQKMDPPQRHFARFSDAAQECAESRIYLGIHFRYDSEQGNALGTQVGRYVIERMGGG